MAVQNLVFDIFARGGQRVSQTFDDIAGSADGLESKLGPAGQKAMRAFTNPVTIGVAGAVTASIGAMALKFGEVAAAAEQNVGAIETVFGKASDAQQKFADGAAEAVGMSASSYNELSAGLGTSLKAAGVPFDELAQKNQDLIERGADMASVFGGTTAESVAAMGAAFRGEFDSLERWGVQLSAAKVEQELARTGQDKLTGSTLEAAKKQAIMNLIMEESAQVTGNFAREADTASGQQERATAKWQDAQATLGTALLPAMTAAAEIFGRFATWLSENSTLVTVLVGIIGSLAAGLLILNAVITITNILMAANLFGIIVLAVVALIAAIVALVANWDTVVAFLTDIWGGFIGWIQNISGAFADWWNGLWAGIGSWIRDTWTGFITFIRALLLAWVVWVHTTVAGFVSRWNATWAAVRAFIAAVWQGIVTGARTMIGNLVGFFRNLPGRILGVLTRAGQWLVSTGRNIISGLLSGIRNFASNLWEFFTSIPGRVKGLLSGAGSWLVGTGRNIVDGLLNGIGQLAGRVGSFFLNLLPGWIVGPFKAALGIASPSKVFRGFGQNIGEGVLEGVGDLEPAINNRIGNLVQVPDVAPALGALRTNGNALAGRPGTAGTDWNGAGRPTQVVYMTVNNPVAEPASRARERASDHIAIGGGLA